MQLPLSTLSALERLGADPAVTRLRRKESLVSWATRLGVSVPTLMRLESGEPVVGMRIYASALWLVGRDGALADLASTEADAGALERNPAYPLYNCGYCFACAGYCGRCAGSRLSQSHRRECAAMQILCGRATLQNYPGGDKAVSALQLLR